MSIKATEKESEWFYLDGEETRGPYPASTLKTLLAAGSISGSTYVCQDGMDAWKTAGEVLELSGSVKVSDGETTAGEESKCAKNNGKVSQFPTFARWFRSGKEKQIKFQTVIGSKQIPSIEEQVTNTGKLFVWWPASIIGNVIASISLGYFAIRLFAAIAIFVVLKQEGATVEMGGIVVGSALFLLAYFVIIAIRYINIVSPHKRLLKKAGKTQNEKVEWLDFAIERSKSIIIGCTLFVIFMAWQVWVDGNEISADRETIGRMESQVQSTKSEVEQVQSDTSKQILANTTDEDLRKAYEHDIREGIDQDTAANWYQANKAQVDAAKESLNQIGSDAITTGLEALDTVKKSALDVKTYKLLRAVEMVAASIVGAFACWLWQQSKREKRLTQALQEQR